MQFTIYSSFFVLLAMLSTAWSTLALPILQPRTVYDPRITYPAAGDVYTAGDTITVTWDTSSIPADAPNKGMIVLGQSTPNSENLQINNPLAEGFPLTAGYQEITFPSDLQTASNYILVLFGDSGNTSAEFTVNAYDASE